MRVVDLDRDMSDVIPIGTTLDSDFLFERMTDRALALVGAAPGRSVLDVASGVGQDAVALRKTGARVVAAEPSRRMIGVAQLIAVERKVTHQPHWVRGWSDALPFASDTFDATICKGAIDHFDCPDEAISEMARVTRPRGRVVLAIANFESLACRVARGMDEWKEGVRGRKILEGRRSYDAPSDHFTRYELELMREQAGRYLDLEVVEGVSLGWGLPFWSERVTKMPRRLAWASLQALDRVARRVPGIADVVLLAGRPRRSAITSA